MDVKKYSIHQEKHGFGSREVVVDGQQRLTTTLLMLIALRDSVSDSERKKQIENIFLKNPASTFSDKSYNIN
uniref:DUF262 domain-containing protein n=1 Tax=uncultured bacterium contig00025 TaxID=1181514 RepID=A0A806KJQ0_9BACT|nr:hypothetical protein [uncultured bacterium contig00025]